MATKQLSRVMGRSVLGAIAVGLFSVISACVIGAYSPETLEWMHLDWLAVPLRGIYADCSDPRNHNVGFCAPSSYDAPSSGGRMISEKGRPAPFQLHGD